MSYSLVSLDTLDNIVRLNVIFNKANMTQLILGVAKTPEHTKPYFHYEQLIVVIAELIAEQAFWLPLFYFLQKNLVKVIIHVNTVYSSLKIVRLNNKTINVSKVHPKN